MVNSTSASGGAGNVPISTGPSEKNVKKDSIPENGNLTQSQQGTCLIAMSSSGKKIAGNQPSSPRNVNVGEQPKPPPPETSLKNRGSPSVPPGIPATVEQAINKGGTSASGIQLPVSEQGPLDPHTTIVSKGAAPVSSDTDSEKAKLGEKFEKLRSKISDIKKNELKEAKENHKASKCNIISEFNKQGINEELSFLEDHKTNLNDKILNMEKKLNKVHNKLRKANPLTKKILRNKKTKIKKSLKNLIQQRIRIDFLKEKYNKTNNKVTEKQAALDKLEKKLSDMVSKLTDSFDVNNMSSIKNANDFKLSANQTVTTTIPSELTGGIFEPKSHNDNRQLADNLASNVDQLREALINQIPDTPLDMRAKVGQPGRYFGNHNYMLDLDVFDNIQLEERERPDGKGKEYVMNANLRDFGLNDEATSFTVPDNLVVDGKPYVDKGTATMCDDGQVMQSNHNNKFTSACFNDGSNWGDKPANAAKKGNEIALKVLDEELGKLENKDSVSSQDIIRAHDKALMDGAQKEIAESDDCGNTCPLLLTVAGGRAHISSVGDAKCFILKPDLSGIREPTIGNRGGVDGKDPGGRLGGYANEGKDADLRNYSHFVTPLASGEFVIMCSDGVHDNLDPKHLGLSPSDVKLSEADWEDTNENHLKAREQFVQNKFLLIVNDYQKNHPNIQQMSHKDINTALYEFVQKTTAKTKLFMIKTGKAEPKSYKDFPGKMDHAAMIIYQHTT